MLTSISFSFAQDRPYKFSGESYNAAKFEILDVIINDSRFDSINRIYNPINCVFLTDEEFSETIIIQLKEQNAYFKTIDGDEYNACSYWFLGDFYINPYLENPDTARVQLSYNIKGNSATLIGIEMEKKDGKWEIIYFTIIE